MQRICIGMALAAALVFSARANEKYGDTQKRDDKFAAKMTKGEAKRHIWISDVALERAKIGLQGLYALADDTEGAWGNDEAGLLINAIERDVHAAGMNLKTLAGLPGEKDEAHARIAKVMADLAQVMNSLKTLERPIKSGMIGSGGDVGSEDMNRERKDSVKVEKGTSAPQAGDSLSLKNDLKSCWKQLDMTITDFHKVADDYKVSTRLPTP